MPSTYRGKLEHFSGSWQSGLGFLIIDGIPIPCENAATVRALESCFGGVIQAGNTVSSDSFKGCEVVYSVDEFGLLLRFTPIEDSSYLGRSSNLCRRTPT
jgi:benzoyl-CoA reductase/2-hydroxyglutaryl-CoA dehydratase subunit BcrC/BadD/HgdB